MSYAELQRRISLDADSSIGIYTGISGMPGAVSPNYGKQFSYVKITGTHQAGLATGAANERPIGILQNKPQKVGTAAEISLGGSVSQLIAGAGDLAAGASVKLDANGHGITATLPADVAKVVAECIEGAVAGALAVVLQR